MSAPLDSVTPELRDTLSNFAAGLFGLYAWINEPAQYKPDGPTFHGARWVTRDSKRLRRFRYRASMGGLSTVASCVARGIRWTLLEAGP